MQLALVGLEQAGDRDIGQYVREHDYAIVTKDADCYDMSLMRGARPYAIWLQAGNVDRTAF
jgi:predicted nuclease of predicted toxin-antitoxin system